MDTAPVVKRIFDMAKAGTGMLQTSKALNHEGIASPTGKHWFKNGIHFIPKNEVYTGTLIWGVSGKSKDDPVRVEKVFAAIVSNTKFHRVNRLMQSRAPEVAIPAELEAPTCSAAGSPTTSASPS